LRFDALSKRIELNIFDGELRATMKGRDAALHRLNKQLKWVDDGFVCDLEKCSNEDVNTALDGIESDTGYRFKVGFIVDESDMDAVDTSSEEENSDEDDDYDDGDGDDDASSTTSNNNNGLEPDNDVGPTYTCSKCGLKFSRLGLLSVHMAGKHKSVTPRPVKRLNIIDSQDAPTNLSPVYPTKRGTTMISDQDPARIESSIACVKCGKRFTRIDNCKRHRAICTKTS
jgi:hypothetical protein